MHSRIFQLELEKVEPDMEVTENEIFDNTSFMGPVADYALEITDDKMIDSDIEDYFDEDSHLSQYGLTLDAKNRTIKFNKGFKDRYFEKKYEFFKRTVADIDFEVFKEGGMPLYFLKKSIEDRFDLYFFSDGNLMNIDEFFRDMEEEKTYHFGSVFDYHS